MTKEKKREGLILSYDGMIWAQMLMDSATTKREQKIAKAMYESFWCIWQVLTEDKRKEAGGGEVHDAGPAGEAAGEKPQVSGAES